MITKENFKKVLSFLGFEKEAVGECYSKIYSTCNIHVDFDKEALIYPEDKGLVVNDKTTSNFSRNENFVVFECVCRLLNKGYRPEHIELDGNLDVMRKVVRLILLSRTKTAIR